MKYSSTSFKKMADFTDIKQGHLFRKGIRNLPHGEIYLIQPSDIDQNGIIDPSNLHRVKKTEIKETALIDQNDIVVKSKSSPPVFFKVKDSEGPFAVTDQFLIININKKYIISDFLLWYLRSRNSIIYFQARMDGTSVPFLKKETLKNMEIPIPSINNQERIVMMNKLIDEEKMLVEEITDHKKKMIEQLSMNIIQGE